MQTEATATYLSSLGHFPDLYTVLGDDPWLFGVWQVLPKELKWEGGVADSVGRLRTMGRKGRDGGSGLSQGSDKSGSPQCMSEGEPRNPTFRRITSELPLFLCKDRNCPYS